MAEYNDYPFEECEKAAREHAANGALVLQKWTCAGCKQRVTANNPNHWTAQGLCENCGTLTDLKKTGCNYALAFSGITAADLMEYVMFGSIKKKD